MSLFTLITIGFFTSVLIMCIAWLACVRLKNAGWVDVVWAYSIGLLSIGYFFLSDISAISPLGLGLIMIWSSRLGSHLAIRIATEPEDGRYLELKRKWGGPKSPKLFGFFMIQALAAFLFSLPALIAIRNTDGAWSSNEWIAVTIAAIAIIGESISDWQLKTFKTIPSNKGKVCKNGLWRYSRHPNYFFEWIFWFSFVAVSFHTSAVWTLLAAPAIMLFLVLKVTGIPPTEAQAIRKRGDLYKQYQKETSAFVPWFPKSKSSQS